MKKISGLILPVLLCMTVGFTTAEITRADKIDCVSFCIPGRGGDCMTGSWGWECYHRSAGGDCRAHYYDCNQN